MWYYMQSDKKAQNKMRDIRVAKLVLNICVGESGDRLQKAAKVSNLAAAFGFVPRVRAQQAWVCVRCIGMQ